MTAQRRRRVGSSRRAIIGDDADRPQNQNANSMALDHANVDANISSNITGAVRSNCRSRFMTCTMMLVTLATLTGAIRHNTAFVTRIGHRANLMDNNRGNRALPSSDSYNKKLSQTNFLFQSRHMMATKKSRYHLSSLWMTSGLDVESSMSSQTDSENNEDEWRTVLAAFQMYKAAYGDLKVPSRFVVPGMAPWPGKRIVLLL